MKCGVIGKSHFQVVNREGLQFTISAPAEIVLVCLYQTLSFLPLDRSVIVVKIESECIQDLVGLIVVKPEICAVAVPVPINLPLVEGCFFSIMNDIPRR